MLAGRVNDRCLKSAVIAGVVGVLPFPVDELYW